MVGIGEKLVVLCSCYVTADPVEVLISRLSHDSLFSQLRSSSVGYPILMRIVVDFQN